MTAILLGWLLTLQTPADAATPQTILDRAIAAQGGAESLRKLGQCLYLSEAVLSVNGQPQPVMKMRRLLRLPDCLRLEIETQDQGIPQQTTYALRGKHGWMQQDGQYLPLQERLVNALLDDMHCLKIQYLLEAKELRYTLHALPVKRVEGAPADGLSVRADGLTDVDLYFDQKTGMLVKSEMRIRDTLQGHLIFQEIFLQDYRDTNGVKYPHRIVIYQNYSKYMDMKVTEVRPLEKIRDSEFLSPGLP